MEQDIPHFQNNKILQNSRKSQIIWENLQFKEKICITLWVKSCTKNIGKLYLVGLLDNTFLITKKYWLKVQILIEQSKV